MDHKEKWHCTTEDKIPFDARYESVLYVKYRAEDVEASGEDQEYWGPFYIDIDVKDDIRTALADLREIVAYFKQQFGVVDEDLRLFASGGKGFHLELNPYLYMDDKFRVALPLRYRALAARIKQDIGMHLNIDMGIYSQGKGRQWRRVNVKRENGNYKVLVDNLDNFNPEIIKSPGNKPLPFTKGKANALLHSWFNSTKKLADLVGTSEPVPVEVIRAADTPECVKKLANNKDVKHQVNSNLLAMQAISYGMARGWTIEQILSYNNNFISNYRSSQYRTPAAFEDHFRGLYDYAKERPDKFKFGCKMMLSCVSDIDCNACEVKIGEAKQSFGSIYIKDGCYWIIPDNVDMPHRQLTNFIIRWDYRIRKANGQLMNIYSVINDYEVNLVDADRTAFDSKQTVTRLCGTYQAYFGGDKEVPMLKLAVAHLNNPRDRREVGYTGLVWEEDEWHFVTKEGSLSLGGTIDLIKSIVGINLANDTRLNFETTEPTPADIVKVFNNLLKLNIPTIAMPVIAWFFNCFFNPHAQFTNETSPSLFVTGLHGSGKTQTMIQLHRLFAPARPAFPSISATTAFSMNKYASGTNLMPLIFDEFKPSANASRNNEEGQVSQAIRSSYNKAFESRGTQNREVDQTPFYAPLAIIGEQQLNEGAIADRVILVQMDKSSHTVDNTTALEELKQLEVEKIGAHFLEYVMRVSPKEYMESVLRIDKVLEINMPDVFDSRPRRNIANLCTAMDFVQQYVLVYTGDEQLVDTIQSYMDIYVASFKQDFMAVGNELRKMDDISAILLQLNDLADLSDSSLGDLVLMPNRHYRIKDGVLYIDVLACYKLVSAYTKKYGIHLYITDRSSFIAQLSHKAFSTFKASKSDIIINEKPRIVVGINLELAKEQNLIFDNFKGVY